MDRIDHKSFLSDLINHLTKLEVLFGRAEILAPTVADYESRLEHIKSEIEHHETVKLAKRAEMESLHEQIKTDKKNLFDDFDAYVKDTHTKMKEEEARILAELDPLHELHNSLVSEVQAKKLELSSLDERIKAAHSKLAELKAI